MKIRIKIKKKEVIDELSGAGGVAGSPMTKENVLLPRHQG